MNLVKLRFLRDGKPQGVNIPTSAKRRLDRRWRYCCSKGAGLFGNRGTEGIITMVDVPESEVEKLAVKAVNRNDV